MTKRLLTWTTSALLLPLALAEQPSAPDAVAAPMRDLPWGDLNFLQTTDSHGWHAGHLQEPQYSADWGDYISFAERMRAKADEQGVDLLLIDCGDRIEGNGLYDGSDPKGEYLYDIVREQAIDVITTGNHELYQEDSAAREYNQSVPNFKGNYLASNLDYINPQTGKQIAMAQRYRKFTTKNKGIRVLAFGFLFDFTGNGKNTVVQPVEKTIKEEWFQEAIREDVDLFLVAGHVTLNGPEYKALFKAIRSQNWDTPIQFFGGHSHIRNSAKYDSKAYGLQAGRYMETIGWQSIKGISGGGKKEKKGPKELEPRASMSFKRRYIDTNLFGYHYHTGLNDSTFSTEHGKNVSSMIHNARKALKLDHSFGCAPRNLWLNRAQYPGNDSVFTWLEDEVMPSVVVKDVRKDTPRIAITNTGAMRFDIFKGAFTKDTTYIISPFISKLLYIRDVPYKSAKGVLKLLNEGGPVFSSADMPPVSQLAPPEQMSIHANIIPPLPPRDFHPSNGAQAPLVASEQPDLVPGYTTKDAIGNDGDDTLHEPIQFFRVPNCIQSDIAFPKDGEPENVDLVFVDFIQPWILLALEFSGQSYTAENVELYMEDTLTELMAGWIKENWKKDC
ncbi:Uncharacterized protein LOCC1_G004005 [Lachnellula occidentalis]|uniref:Calcineurin-like phosphoesterase domain-containing protein n=1 Tax=Lachnellula occidentalis TaxID=215460 RepID=A0A8H8RX74_9HELO|nr:Uncharacterized protein LOCC1_G004005 [Lachnellula occidentalis]